jgi:hypothetical protein
MIRRFVVITALAASVAMSSSFVGGCGSLPDETDEESKTSALAVGQSPEEHFRGVFFGTGVVGKALPEVWSPSALNEDTRQISAEATASELEKLAATLPTDGEGPAARAEILKTVKQLRNGELTTTTLQEKARAVIASRTSASAVTGLVRGIAAANPRFLPKFRADVQSGDRVRIAAAVAEGHAALVHAMNPLLPKATKAGGDPIAPNDDGSNPTPTPPKAGGDPVDPDINPPGSNNPTPPKPGGDPVNPGVTPGGDPIFTPPAGINPVADGWYRDTDVFLYGYAAVAVAVVAVAVAAAFADTDPEASALRKDVLIDSIARRLDAQKFAGVRP